MVAIPVGNAEKLREIKAFMDESRYRGEAATPEPVPPYVLAKHPNSFGMHPDRSHIGKPFPNGRLLALIDPDIDVSQWSGVVLEVKREGTRSISVLRKHVKDMSDSTIWVGAVVWYAQWCD